MKILKTIRLICRFILGLNKCKFVPTRIDKKYQLTVSCYMKLGEMPTENQSSIEVDSVFIQPCCYLIVTNETQTLIEFKVVTNSCNGQQVAKNGQIVWYQRDLFKHLPKKELKCNEN